jgi:ubiquinone biosynthesis protein COQ9
MPAPDFSDMTLDELRPLLASAVAQDAGFDGWSVRALNTAATRIGVDPAVARLAFPGGGAEMIDAWFAWIDVQMLQLVTSKALAKMKIREKISALVTARLTLLAPHKEALRRAQAILANPVNAKHTLQLGWRAADAMWRAAGDTATDYNHYTKRAIIGSVYGATLLVFVNDDSEGSSDTHAFLARRIEGIMRFEKAKARFTSGGEVNFSLTRLLGRLRYLA